jgi:hypothetical protein
MAASPPIDLRFTQASATIHEVKISLSRLEALGEQGVEGNGKKQIFQKTL